MKRVLLVDDDPLLLRIYQDGLARHGLQVETAADGLAAMKALHTTRPELVVLDLMMPKMSGVDVLKYMRSHPDLKDLPVVVLSNSYMDELAQAAAQLGVQKALLKVRCTPALLAQTLNEIGSGSDSAAGEGTPHLMAASGLPAAATETRRSAPCARTVDGGAPSTPRPASERSSSGAEAHLNPREEFLSNAPATCASLRQICGTFTTRGSPAEQNRRLQDFYRKVHLLTASAAMVECLPIAQLASVMEALLFVLMDKPARIGPSVMRTATAAVDFFEVLFAHARNTPGETLSTGRVLLLDSDPLSARLVVSALRNAQIQARNTPDPDIGLRWLQEQTHDLILIDLDLPGQDGVEVGTHARALTGYQRTPIIYVVTQQDFESRSQTVLSDRDDFISKPVLPLELAVKVVMHLLKSRLAS